MTPTTVGGVDLGGARPTAAEWIRRLGLAPHPEGGHFRETYRAPLTLPPSALPEHGGARAASTAILFVLEAGEFSALHRIRSDELWHFHLGDPLIVHVLHADRRHEAIVLGPDLAAGQRLQAVVPAGATFGARVVDGGSASLVGCTVAPGFDFADFVMPTRDELHRTFPEHRALVDALTRG